MNVTQETLEEFIDQVEAFMLHVQTKVNIIQHPTMMTLGAAVEKSAKEIKLAMEAKIEPPTAIEDADKMATYNELVTAAKTRIVAKTAPTCLDCLYNKEEFEGHTCTDMPRCSNDYRTDKRSIIWVKKET